MVPARACPSRTPPIISRRHFLAAATASALSLLTLPSSTRAATPNKTSVGLATDVWGLHNKAQLARGEKGDQSDPLAFLQQCHRLGAAGMQGPLGLPDADYLLKLRRFALDHQLYIEGSIDLSSPRLDFDRIDKQLATAKDAGATVVRTVVIPGRRYEYFNSSDQFTLASTHALETLRQIEPLAARHRLRIAVENHKDHRIPERLDLLKRLSSEWIGLCVDLGNSFALCEDPLEAVRAYAPYAYTVHIKDQALKEHEAGFLFGDAPLGQGFLDLPAMVRLLLEAKPDIRFSLEVITRDPLLVPVLTPKYWATMPTVPATDLARTLRTVKTKASPTPLPTITHLPLDQQADCETRNIEQSLAYAREHLHL